MIFRRQALTPFLEGGPDSVRVALVQGLQKVGPFRTRQVELRAPFPALGRPFRRVHGAHHVRQERAERLVRGGPAAEFEIDHGADHGNGPPHEHRQALVVREVFRCDGFERVVERGKELLEKTSRPACRDR